MKRWLAGLDTEDRWVLLTSLLVAGYLVYQVCFRTVPT